MKSDNLPTTAPSGLLITGGNRAVARRQSTHWFHVREAGKLSRRDFTDSLKAFSAYVDPKGDASSDPGQTYLRLTQKLYSPLGLSSKVIHQLRETVDLNNLRDQMTPRLLLALSVLEAELAAWIETAMEQKELRTTIKQHIDTEAKKTAEFCGVPTKEKKTKRAAK